LYTFLFAGKSTIVNNALYGTAGVLFVDVAPAATHTEIVLDVLRAVTRYNVNFLDVYSGAARVIRWHLRLFRVKPTVVLRVRERAADDKHASVGSAVRVLVEHGLRVVIDSSDNSLQSLAAFSLRQRPVHVEPMELEVLQKVPKLADLLSVLERSGDSSLVWEVLGGVPASYQLLASAWRDAKSPTDEVEVRKVVDGYLESVIDEARSNLMNAQAKYPHFRDVYEQLKTVDKVPDNVLKVWEQPSPDKVLRLVKLSGTKGKVLVPATSAMALVLKYGRDDMPPTVGQLRDKLRQLPQPARPM
jgi:hypothetical protein